MMLKAKYNKITINEEIAEQFATEEFAMTLALGKPPETKSIYSAFWSTFPICKLIFIWRNYNYVVAV